MRVCRGANCLPACLPSSLSGFPPTRPHLCLPGLLCSYIGTWHLRGVSGGQRRRVSIGCELVTSPKLIFL